MNTFGTAGMMVVLGLTPCLAGCRTHGAGEESLVRRDLPGFSLELPAGVEKTAELDYTAGKLRLEQLSGGTGMMVVYWSFGKVVDGAQALDIARTAAVSDGLDAQGAHVLEGKPGGGTLVSIDANGVKLQSYVQCGPRVISIATYEVAERVHREILERLKCAPDPAREAAATSIPIAIDLPGFAAFQRTPGTLALTSQTGTVLLRRQPSTSLTVVELERASALLFRAMNLDAQAQPRRGNLIPFTANVDGGREEGVLRLIDCGDSKILVIAFAADHTSAVDLEQRVRSARCVERGESPPTWPDVPHEPGAPATSQAR